MFPILGKEASKDGGHLIVSIHRNRSVIYVSHDCEKTVCTMLAIKSSFIDRKKGEFVVGD